MPRRVDLAWETLVRETGSNPHVERGELNTALKAIRAACADEGIDEADIPAAIERRAMEYRLMFPRLAMTSMALARHWFRVVTTADDDSGKNLYAKWEEKFRDD